MVKMMALFLCFILFTVVPIASIVRPWVSKELDTLTEKLVFSFMGFLIFFMGLMFWGSIYKPLGKLIGLPGVA